MQVARRFQPWNWRVRITSLGGWRALFLAFLAGALAALGLAPYHVWPIWIVSLAVLVWRLDGVRGSGQPLRRGFWTGFLFGMGTALLAALQRS